MEYDVESKNGVELVITLRMTPEERTKLREAVRYWKKICEETASESTQARMLFFNRFDRHVTLGAILEIVEPLLTEPEALAVPELL